MKLLWTASAERARSSRGAPPDQDREAAGGIEFMFSLFSITVNFCNVFIQKLGSYNVITWRCGSQDSQHLCVYLLGELMLFPRGFS